MGAHVHNLILYLDEHEHKTKSMPEAKDSLLNRILPSLFEAERKPEKSESDPLPPAPAAVIRQKPEPAYDSKGKLLNYRELNRIMDFFFVQDAIEAGQQAELDRE